MYYRLSYEFTASGLCVRVDILNTQPEDLVENRIKEFRKLLVYQVFRLSMALEELMGGLG